MDDSDSSSSDESHSSSSLPPMNRIPWRFHSNGSCSLDGIALRSNFLGMAAGAGLLLTVHFFLNEGYFQLSLFFTALSVFHFLEFYVTARYNTEKAKIDAFLLSTNGTAYNVAHAAACLEGLIEWFLWPVSKKQGILTLMGLLLLTTGQIVRSLAMAHAATNFNHIVATRHKKGHSLVTTGVYRYWRHPSYFGFFYWGLGTQLMLGNPFCFFGYLIVLWKFFKDRITSIVPISFPFFHYWPKLTV